MVERGLPCASVGIAGVGVAGLDAVAHEGEGGQWVWLGCGGHCGLPLGGGLWGGVASSGSRRMACRVVALCCGVGGVGVGAGAAR